MAEKAKARFDDLRPHRRRSFALTNPIGTLVAREIDEVHDVIGQAEGAVAAGKWVAGFVAYEAAPAFDPSLAVVHHGLDETLPLAWFVVAEGRGRAEQPRAFFHQLSDWKPRLDPASYRQHFDEIRRLIRAGETYQVNFTFRLDAQFEGSPEGFYRRLVNSQAGGYGALLETQGWAVASASPELFFEWHNGRIVSKPMKGTRRRGLLVADDEIQRTELEG
ncbi:MAG: chorismate-binding protein, partial [Actinobacteria bacterium]|nr:chorismate-binding protein [Actinomycetota bacterium]